MLPAVDAERTGKRMSVVALQLHRTQPSTVHRAGSTPRQGPLLLTQPGRSLETQADQVADTVGPDLAAASTGGGPGGSLPPGARAVAEARLGHDLSSVRIFADGDAASAAEMRAARAFTRGSDVFFGPGQYAPSTVRGSRLLAHELSHVVQQSLGLAHGVQLAATDCASQKRPDVEATVVARVKAAAKDPAALPELYLALKRARDCFPGFDEAAFVALLPGISSIYPSPLRKVVAVGHDKATTADDRKLAWAESRKPFAGYVVSGFDTAKRFTTGQNLRQLGGTLAPSHEPYREFASDRAKAQKAFGESSVLVFSGHQYAQYKLPGVWTDGGSNTLDVRGITGPLPNVRLLISTSCATLCTEAWEVWKGLFPNAVFLGAARSTPLKGSTLANAFVKRLPKDLLFDPGAPGIASAISAWKGAVEATQTSAVRGGVLDVKAGTVELWDGKKWLSLAAGDKDNACKVKGDYSANVPDPRVP
jgi:hypothetical protein